MTKIIPDVVDNQALYKVPPTASVCDAAKVMAANRISAVLVTEGERLVGIFTERDLTARVVAAGRDPKTTHLVEVMRRRHYRHLPVMDGGQIVGMVSIRDLYAFVKGELEQDVRQREAFIFDTGYGVGA